MLEKLNIEYYQEQIKDFRECFNDKEALQDLVECLEEELPVLQGYLNQYLVCKAKYPDSNFFKTRVEKTNETIVWIKKKIKQINIEVRVMI